MSWSALKWASEVKVGNSTDKLILIILANFTDAENTCYPSHKKIAELCECSTDTVIRSLKRLKELNFIEVEKRFQLTQNNNHRQTSNIYKLLIDTQSQIATPPPMQNATPITYHNKKEYSKEFEIFWKEYPNRPNDNKFGASQKFCVIMKNKEIDFELLLKRTVLFAKSQVGKDEKFIPHAKTWLSQKRYNDVEQPKQRKTNLNLLVG
ncbi:MAG: helix-turn-helix domain-containing protein [Crocinitomicaceae bacterium]|nr:helix-turn-helix domain-containing protein [Crocinitomicaceae bacterium]